MVDMSNSRQVREVVIMDSTELQDIELWTLPVLQDRIHEWAIRKEWRGPNAETQRTTGDDIALIMSECAEALEAFRDEHDPQKIWWTYDVEVDGVKFKHCSMDMLKVIWNCDDYSEVDQMITELGLTAKPQGVGIELGDALVRILDYCAEHGISLLECLQMVMSHNETREIRHGGKHL